MAGVGSQGQLGGRDGFSIAALILGLIAIVPLAVIFGIVGLSRTSGRQRRGRWMAIVGLLAAGCWIVAVVVVGRLAHRPAGRIAMPSGAVSRGGQATLDQIRVGDCIEVPAVHGTSTGFMTCPALSRTMSRWSPR